MPAGRPLKFSSAEELQKAVDEYFEQEPKITLAGLALALDISRSTLYLYEDIEQFSDIIKKARERVEARYEQRLVYENNPTGVIFALKNMDWKDKTERDIRFPEGINLSFEKVPSFMGGFETKDQQKIENQNGSKQLMTKSGPV